MKFKRLTSAAGADFDGHGHRLVIMSYPRELSQDEYDRFNEYLKNVVMQQAADTSFEGIAQEIKTRIDRLLDTQPRVIIAIDGRCGAGKSTLAARLAELCGGNVFHMDDFFLRPEQRRPERFAEPGGNVDRERFAAEVLAPLENGSRFSYRPFVCRNMALGDTVEVEPKTVSFIEGAYSMHPELAGAYDLTVFLSVSPELQHERIMRRNGERSRDFFERWIPFEEKYFREMDVPARCGLIFEARDE